jgi:hypothetical protein
MKNSETILEIAMTHNPRELENKNLFWPDKCLGKVAHFHWRVKPMINKALFGVSNFLAVGNINWSNPLIYWDWFILSALTRRCTMHFDKKFSRYFF